MNRRTVTQDEVIRNIFQQKYGAFELLEQMEREKHGICVECRAPLRAPEELVNTGRGHYTDGPALCAYCKSARNESLTESPIETSWRKDWL